MISEPADELLADSATADEETEEIDPTAPVLALPPELVLDDVARRRLERQLEAAPDDVVGIAASVGPVPPGSSFTTAAERAAMAPMHELRESGGAHIGGAVLLRPEVGFEVGPTHVQVERGRVLLDRGAAVHDPWRPQTALAVASVEGRPPFRWRPVVLLLGLEADLDLAETARGMANGLLARDVEARLAAPALPEGLYLTNPCLPVVETVEALAPDVVIALDPAALGVASSWCGTNRSATVVELTQDITYGIRLVSWRVGVAEGRLRARIGRAVDLTELARLVNRLCSGPQPVPPLRSASSPRRDGSGAERAVAISRRRPVASHRSASGTVVAVGSPEGAGQPTHLRTLVDGLLAAGSAVQRETIDTVDSAVLGSAPLVVVSSSAGADAVRAVLERRAGDGRPTLLDIEPTDAVDPTTLADGPLELRAGLEAMAVTGFAVAPSLALATEVRALGPRVQVVPHLVAPAQRAALEQADQERTDPAEPVIGWRIGHVGPVPALAHDALCQMADSLLDAGVRLEIVASLDRVPGGLADRAGVVVHTHEPTPAELARWTVQVWTPPERWAEISGDVRGMVEAGFAGVPTVIGASDRRAVASQIDLNLVVEEIERASAWEEAVRRLFDERERASRCSRAREASVALHGPDANRLRVARLMGWLGLIGPL
jgi:hypothetical protein